MESTEAAGEKNKPKKRPGIIKIFIIVFFSYHIPLAIGMAIDKIYLYNSDYFGAGTLSGVVVGWSIILSYLSLVLHNER